MAGKSSSKDQSARELRGYGFLEILLGAGLILAIGLAAIGVGSPGWLSIESAFTAMAVAVGAVGIISWLTLERVRRSLNTEIQGDTQEAAQMRHSLDVRTKALQESHAALAQTVRTLTTKLDEANRSQSMFAVEQKAQHTRIDSRLSRLAARLPAQEHQTAEVRALETKVDHTVGYAPQAKPAAHAKQPVSLTEMEGISDSYMNRLHQEGIFTAADLAAANSRSLAIKIQAFPGQVQAWQVMAQLMELRGVGPQYAEVLEASGIHSVDELARADAQKLLEQAVSISDGMDQKVPGINQVQDWIKQAKSYQPAR